MSSHAWWIKRIREIRRHEGFNGRKQEWQTFETPLPALSVLTFAPLPVLCGWCDKELTRHQIVQQHRCCSIRCGQLFRYRRAS